MGNFYKVMGHLMQAVAHGLEGSGSEEAEAEHRKRPARAKISTKKPCCVGKRPAGSPVPGVPGEGSGD